MVDMKIVLIQDSAELTFQQEQIKIGRNANECQISFARENFPMVSRYHAELQHRDNQWFLVDQNSTYGTFLNGQKIVQAQSIQIGSEIQFGVDGPVLIVILLEVGGAGQSVYSNPQIVPPSTSQTESKPFFLSNPSVPFVPQAIEIPSPIPNQNQPNTPPKLPQIEFVGKPEIPPFIMTKDEIWMGRDPNCDIVIEKGTAMVSRRHAQIVRQNSGFVLNDNGSFNGTMLKGQRISTPMNLSNGDEIQLGTGGPILRFNLPVQVVSKIPNVVENKPVIPPIQNAGLPNFEAETSPKTMVMRGEIAPQKQVKKTKGSQLLMSLRFNEKSELIIGRDEKSDIRLDGLQISNRHARLQKTANGVYVEDLNSTNGVYFNGQRTQRQLISAKDAVQIGSFVIRIDEDNTVGVFDTRSKTRIDCVKITKEVKNRAGGGKIKLLDEVSLSIQPNEFIGLLGPSGAGKSTLMDAMNGVRPADGGSVLINNSDLYEHLDSLKQSIGYVPQDDIIHRELSVYRTLYYVAKLRLSQDVSKNEINEIINEVLEVTGLTEKKDLAVSQLSGGQRKRVSIAVELITKPSIIFLDEPTSGLDPATEEKIMKLFRQIAESGRTVILTTHAMENVTLFDKIVVLMRGKLVFYGKPEEALAHVGAKNFKELYDKLEEPIALEGGATSETGRIAVTDRIAEDWKQKFAKTPQFKANVYEPLKEIGKTQSQGVQKKSRLGIFGAIRQWMTLSRRYLEVLFRDKLTLFILFAQAPIVALLTFLVMDNNRPRDIVYLVLALVSIWFGTSLSAREIIRERPVYNRERMVNLGLFPYLGSKLFILGIIVGIQCFLFVYPAQIF